MGPAEFLVFLATVGCPNQMPVCYELKKISRREYAYSVKISTRGTWEQVNAVAGGYENYDAFVDSIFMDMLPPAERKRVQFYGKRKDFRSEEKYYRGEECLP